jgi:GYF domain 2
MEWYYALNDQRIGPVSESEFDGLVRAGTITRTTLVWRAGLPDWQPYDMIFPAQGATPASGERCAECGNVFPKSEMLAYENLFVCASCKPLFFQKVQEGVPVGAARVWRSGKFVVMGLKPELPDACVKCNAPVNGVRLKRKLRWHHPAIYLVLLVNIVVYAIVASLASKRAEVTVGLCPAHRAKRIRAIAIGWVLALLGLGAIPWAIGAENGGIALAGVLFLVVGLLWGVIGGRVVYAKKIDTEHAWMAGCGQAYLAALPEWRGN